MLFITNIKIPSSVTSIGEYAFCCNLKTVVIDSENTASGLIEEETEGCLIDNATTVYIKTTIVDAGKVGSYVTEKLPEVETITSGEYAGYTKYTQS